MRKNLIFLFLIERWRIIEAFGLNEKTGTVFFDHKKSENPWNFGLRHL